MATAPGVLDHQKAPTKLGNRLLFWTGTTLFVVGLGVLIRIFAPVLLEEVRYEIKLWREHVTTPQQTGATYETPAVLAESTKVLPVNEQFGIVIPKIGANARIIAEVDWREPRLYQEALRQGVAHAAGSAVPGTSGNVFLFAHSGEGLLQAARYNAVFYLLTKLEPDDEVDVYYKGKRYQYRVTQLKKVSREAVEYVQAGYAPETLTLMTCWPAGTTWKRLIVEARLDDNQNQ